jgi:voltage-gated sodium channel
MEKYPYAWLFFIPFIIATTFTVLNLFIGIIVNAMQAEHEKVEAAERKAEREMMHDETAPLVAEMQAMRAELSSLRTEIAQRLPPPAA